MCRTPTVSRWSLWLLLTLVACKEGGPGGARDGGGETIDAKTSYVAEFNAADADYLAKNGAFFFRVWNQTFSRKLDELPASGEVTPERMPMSGGYYPESDGGTDVVVAGNKSPLAKYDDAFNGGQKKAVTWEREKHTNGPSWAGHCNGFAAAGARHAKEPGRSVAQNGVVFAPQDIKALMAEIYMSADYEFLGGNRCERTTGQISSDRVLNPGRSTDPTVMDACEDINPGTLHAAVTNWVGRMRHPLVMDSSLNEEVWNYPLVKYQVLRNERVPSSLARQYVSNSGGAYVFNPLATQFALIQMRLTYVEAFRKEVLGQRQTRDMDLFYILELDRDGGILGGEWASEGSRKNHPDFLWVPLEPLPGNGTRFLGNPHVDPKEVLRLWAVSAGYEPDNPPPTIKRPPGVEDWGNWPAFSVRLDGNDRGAVFAGKPVTLRVQRKGPLLGPGFNLELNLNGAPLASLSTTGNEELTSSFVPGLGLNRVEMIWRKDGGLVDNQSVRFHTTP